MPGKTLEQQIAEMKESFFSEGLLDEFWTQLESLEDEENPSFVEDAVDVFFTEIPKDIAAVEETLEEDQVDFPYIRAKLLKIKGSSSSIGMVTITTKLNEALEICEQENLEGCKGSINELKEEVDTMKEKLEAYFQLLNQARHGK